MSTPVNKRTGGLSMPKPGSADAALQALMNEQKAGITAPSLIPEASDTGSIEYRSTGVPEPANTANIIPALPPVQEPLYKDGREYSQEDISEGRRPDWKERASDPSNIDGREGGRTRGRAPSPATARARSREALKAGALLPLEEAVREAIKRGRKHPTDQKTSIDMPRSIMRRAKRYLFDEHNEATLRLLIAELLDEFLTREGYPPEE